MSDSFAKGLKKLGEKQRAFVNLLKGWTTSEEFEPVKTAVEQTETGGVRIKNGVPELISAEDATNSATMLAEGGFETMKLIREHDVLTRKFDKDFEKIDKFVNPNAEFLKKFHEATKAVPRPPDGTDKKKQKEYAESLSKNANKLAGLRDNYENAANALIDNYANAAPSGQTDDDPYWEEKVAKLADQNRKDITEVGKLVPPNAGVDKEQKDWNAKGNKLWADMRGGKITKKAYYEGAWDNIQECAGILERAKIVTEGYQDFAAEFRKVQAKIDVAAEKNSALKGSWTTLKADSQKKDANNFKNLLTQLREIDKQAETVLKEQVTVLRADLKKTSKNFTAAGKTNDTRDIIARTDPLILDRLNLKEQRQAFDLLCSYGVPPTDKKDSNYKDREALQKLMSATSIDPEFLRRDNEKSELMVANLKKNKEEFKVARDNWSIMKPEQKLEVITKLATAQAAAFEFKMPKRGVTLKKMESGYQGMYSPGPSGKEPPDDVVEINPDGSYLEDFQTTCEMIFHEMTHKYQNTLIRRLKSKTSDGEQITEKGDLVLYSQAMMFQTAEMTGSGRSATIAPEENEEAYKKQPKEGHAWTAGPRSMRQFLKMLSE